MENSEIIRRYNAHKSDRTTIESVWDVIEQFVTPYRGRMFQDVKNESSVDWRNRDLFDSTAIMANQTLASSIHGSLTSPATRWFDLRFRNEDLNTDGDAMKWLEEVASRIYYALQDSNFNLEAAETYTDLCSMGSSVILEEFTGDAGSVELEFASIPVKECFFAEDHKGNIHEFYRRLNWTPTQIKTKFGDKIPEHIEEACAAGKMDRHEVVFCVFCRGKGEYAEDRQGPIDPLRRKYGYKYVLVASGDTLGEEGGYYEMPAYIPRWRKTTDSKWGNSPAMIALPDILTLNQLVELILRSAEKVVDPALLVTERGLLSDVDLQPAGMTVVRDLEQSMKPFESRARFDVTELQREKLKESINRTFYVDQLELKNSPAMTATEVQVRYELMQRLLGPTLGRLMNDFLNPLIERTFSILYRMSMLPERPEVLQNESDLDIQYTGPLVRSQKMDVASSTERWLQALGVMAQFSQDVLEYPDFEMIARDYATTLNVPAKYMKSKAKIASERRNRQQAQGQAMAIEQAKAAGEAGEAIGKAKKEMGSM